MGKPPSFVFLIISLNCFISSLAWIDTNITIDKSALLVLKSFITSDPYDFLSTWSLSSSPCNWVGVSCNTRQGRVRSLNLGGMDLKGTLTPQLANLSFLVELDLSSNNFYGQIPRELARLRRLKLLNLSCNDFHGQVSTWIGDLSTLEHLNIRNNSFEGFIPLTLFNLSRLETLDWNNNLIEGTIPIEVGRLECLKILQLLGNKLLGIILQMISNLSSLELLSLSYNTLSGNVPSIWHQCKELADLVLGDNIFNRGVIPTDIGNLTNLQTLYLDNINLQGFIPKEIGNLVKLEVLDLGSNHLSGPITFNGMSLAYIFLEDNFFTGRVHFDHFFGENMSFIDMSSNLLQGELTSTICNASSLGVLNLSHNNFSGQIPRCIGSSTLAFYVLDLQSNSFYGSIPETFEVGNKLRTSNLNDNLLYGLLPQSLVHCNNLEVLDLGRNGIHDTFPHWVQNLKELQVLVLRENKLHGFIPNLNSKSNYAFTKLRVFDISNNKLSGPLPETYFKNFDAMKNREGEISLEYMGYNQSSNFGKYHDSIEVTLKGHDIHMEKVLTIFICIDISDNMFEGEIPISIGQLRALKGLNFSNNRLIGVIPNSIGNLRNLEWLDLSSNKLIGKIPIELINLNFLSILNLSRNQLEGCIPRGQQFETFTSDSFEGNKQLYGFQLMIPCNSNRERQPPLQSSSFEDRFEFGWKPILLGYVCGAFLGSTMFWIVIFTGKPQRLASLVDDPLKKRRRRPSFWSHLSAALSVIVSLNFLASRCFSASRLARTVALLLDASHFSPKFWLVFFFMLGIETAFSEIVIWVQTVAYNLSDSGFIDVVSSY
ncbi:receptor-like protein 33 [Prosopis cineraria]|uniref:receptor-like protein 33 n=1 Tax=Prosopis cineraria TaxID=364024 RepID=UPI00240EC343|nr:receptor-like protein 33 [Prosopis cineraria]